MKIKSFCFSTKKQEHLFLQIKSNSSIKASRQGGGNGIPIELSPALRIKTLRSLRHGYRHTVLGLRGMGMGKKMLK